MSARLATLAQSRVRNAIGKYDFGECQCSAGIFLDNRDRYSAQICLRQAGKTEIINGDANLLYICALPLLGFRQLPVTFCRPLGEKAIE